MKFNEKEVGKLIQRATELHEQSAGDSEQKLSITEIESIAGELGVPARFLQEAALELRDGAPTKNAFSFWGAPFMVDQTRFAEGEFSEKEWNEILLELQNHSGKTGTSGTVGEARHWMYEVGEGSEGFSFEKLKVTMRPENEGRTSIHIRQDYQGAVVMYVMAFGITSFLTLMVAHSLPDVAKLTELIYAGMGGALSLGGVRALVAVSAKRYKEKLSQLADRLTQIVDRSDPLMEDQQVMRGVLEIPEPDTYGTEKGDLKDDSKSEMNKSMDR